MGQDYAKRKSAKKAWKRVAAKRADGDDQLEDRAQRRERKKKGTRRICQGMCWKAPELTAEDRNWNGKLDGEDGSSSGGEEAPGSHDANLEVLQHNGFDVDVDPPPGHGSRTAYPANGPANDVHTNGGSADKAKNKRKRAKGDGAPTSPGAIKLSTGVQLLDPALAAAPVNGHRSAAGSAATAAPVVEATALAPYPPLVRQYMLAQGFAEPTPIQEACWPALCAGRDAVGVAEPGSGKTLAYLLPAAVRLQAAGHGAATLPVCPAALVLAPTRELAAQIAGVARGLRAVAGLRVACVHGGTPKAAQVELLGHRPHILVATPGRLLDLMDDGHLKLAPPSAVLPAAAASTPPEPPAGVAFVVLDEADKMLSLGFEPQLARLRALLLPAPPQGLQPPGGSSRAAASKGKKHQRATTSEGVDEPPAPARPQVALFTATLPDEVQAACAQWASPTALRATASHSAASISRTVVQVVHVCAEHKKPAKLLKHLAAVNDKAAGQRNPPRVLVFANRIKTVRYLHGLLVGEGYRAVMLHGQRSQDERDDALRGFRSGKAQVMVASDVAARGLDVRGLPYVVNYDFPGNLATYIHRVGRTGRLAAYGHAYSFLTRPLARLAAPVLELLHQHGQAVDPNLVQLAAAWREAEARLGPGALPAGGEVAAVHRGADEDESEEGGDDFEDHPADAMLEAEDLREGLGAARTKKSTVMNANTSQRQQRDAFANSPSAAAAPSLQQRLKKQKLSAAAAMAAEEEAAAGGRPVFVAAARFVGARPGYAFKLGAQGLGYYLDSPPRKLSRAALLRAQAKGRGPVVPIGPVAKRGGSRFDSSSEEEDVGGDMEGEEDEQGANDAEGSVEKLVHAKGHLKAPPSNKQVVAAKPAKPKPLPGRLRKRLAKLQQHEDAAAGQ